MGTYELMSITKYLGGKHNCLTLETCRTMRDISAVAAVALGAREPNEMHIPCQLHAFLGSFQQTIWLLFTLSSLSMSLYIECCCPSQAVLGHSTTC